MTTDQQYFNRVWPLCLSASKTCGVFPEIIFAQSALETGYGLHTPGNNFFGIKAGPSTGVKGSTQDLTTEYINGVAVRIQQHFAGYPTMTSSFVGYAYFLQHNRRYKSFVSGASISAQLVALGTSGYATDPNYTLKIGAIVDLVPEYLKGYEPLPYITPVVGNTTRITPASLATNEDKQMTTSTLPAATAGNTTNPSFLSELGHDFDQAMNPVKSLVTELTAHKTGLQVAISLATSLLPYAPLPAPAATAAEDILNGLSGLANKPIPATTDPATGVVIPEAPAPAEPLPVEAAPVPDAIAEAISDGEDFLSNFVSGGLTLASAEAAARTEVPVVVQEVEDAFSPALGIVKNPNAN